MRRETCCFTGHRNLPAEHLPAIPSLLDDTVAELIGRGIVDFACGGARGFDTLAAQSVLRARAACPYLRLLLFLPCRDQTRGWPSKDAAVYVDILAQADAVSYVADRYRPGCMQERNRRLVDESSWCVSWLTRQAGGTAYTVSYARRQGLAIRNLPDRL